jgi:hypothetical protein
MWCPRRANVSQEMGLDGGGTQFLLYCPSTTLRTENVTSKAVMIFPSNQAINSAVDYSWVSSNPI